MFSGVMEKEHWLHFLMSLKERISSGTMGWQEKTRTSANSNYTIN